MKKVASIIKNNGVAVIKTDTLYGIVGLANNQAVVERIYKIKNRNENKPVIVLISNIDDLKKFDIHLDKKQLKIIESHWPGKVSIILPVENSAHFFYLHKGTGAIAFRLPDYPELCNLIKNTGPLVAPSANLEGELPAKNITEAMEYFGELVDYYKDDGECLECRASKIIKISENNDVVVLRD